MGSAALVWVMVLAATLQVMRIVAAWGDLRPTHWVVTGVVGWLVWEMASGRQWARVALGLYFLMELVLGVIGLVGLPETTSRSAVGWAALRCVMLAAAAQLSLVSSALADEVDRRRRPG